MNGLLQDLRYAVRQLPKAPGFAMIAILALALGSLLRSGTEPVHAARVSDANPIRGPLFWVRSWDAAALVSTVGIFLFAWLAASYISVCGAAKVDSVVALRYE